MTLQIDVLTRTHRTHRTHRTRVLGTDRKIDKRVIFFIECNFKRKKEKENSTRYEKGVKNYIIARVVGAFER